jgi:hypothetical protein
LRIAEEDRMEAGSLEYLELAGMKHLHFANVVPVAGALVNVNFGQPSKAASSELSTR